LSQISSWRDGQLDAQSTLFVAFNPTREDCFCWDLSMTCPHECGDEVRLSRTIWADPVVSDARVLVDVYITSSDKAAGDTLHDILGRNHLKVLPTGPDDLGHQSFVYPEREPYYICWMRNNLCIVTSSFGKKVVRVNELARRLDLRLSEPLEAVESCLEFYVEQSPILVGAEARIGYSLPWQIDESFYLKLVSSGAELFLKDESVHIRSTVSGVAQIAGFASQEGRSPCRGAALITIVRSS